MTFDRTYGTVTLKVGPCDSRVFQIGDAVPIQDGVYVGWEGLVIVKDGKLTAEYPGVVSKFGDTMKACDLMKYFGVHTVMAKERERRENDGKKRGESV